MIENILFLVILYECIWGIKKTKIYYYHMVDKAFFVCIIRSKFQSFRPRRVECVRLPKDRNSKEKNRITWNAYRTHVAYGKPIQYIHIILYKYCILYTLFRNSYRASRVSVFLTVICTSRVISNKSSLSESIFSLFYYSISITPEWKTMISLNKRIHRQSIAPHNYRTFN